MFSIRHVEEDRWAVISEDDVSLFLGTLRECEDWLDAHENQSRPRRGFFGWLRSLFRGEPSSAPKQNESNSRQDERVDQPVPDRNH